MQAFFKYAFILCLIWSGSLAAQMPADCDAPSGKFINMTVLSQCPEAMPADIPHYSFELNFRSQGMVDIDNGFEKYRLAYHPAGDSCRFVIEKATLHGDMYFTFEGDSVLHLMDSAWTKVPSASLYKRLKEPDGKDMSFEHYLNQSVIAGEYAFFKEGNLMPGVITVLANGQVNGMKPYLGYVLCYAGDCLEETDPPARTIELLDIKGNRETFAYKTVGGKMAIEFYKLGPAKSDEKGGRSIGPLVYELRTE